MAANRLIAFLDVAFNYKTLYKSADFRRKLAVMHDLFCDTNLLLKVFTGVGMVGIDDSCRVDNMHLFIHFMETDEIFIVIVLGGISMLADGTPEHYVGQRISRCLHLIATIYKMMWMLCCINRV